MKKQTLTRQEIQKELLAKLNKSKTLSIYLTVIIIIAIIFYSTHLINFLNGTPFDYTGGFKSPDLAPAAAMVLMPILILFLIAIVLYMYYMDLYNIKKGNFQITEEKLCQKEVELRRYYRHTEKENSLYFRLGRVAVEEEVYSSATIGDTFYVVILKSKRNPQLAYHAKYYEIDPMLPQILA